MSLPGSGRVQVGQGGSRRVPEGPVGSRGFWTDMVNLHWSGRVQVGIRELWRVRKDPGVSSRFLGKFRRVRENRGGSPWGQDGLDRPDRFVLV